MGRRALRESANHEGHWRKGWQQSGHKRTDLGWPIDAKLEGVATEDKLRNSLALDGIKTNGCSHERAIVPGMELNYLPSRVEVHGKYIHMYQLEVNGGFERQQLCTSDLILRFDFENSVDQQK